MKSKKINLDNLKYYAVIYDVNADDVIFYNVFEHGSFKKSVTTLLNETDDYDTFKSELKKELMYYFWSKCEWEIVVTGFPIDKTKKKLDVYDQVIANFDIFAEYIWKLKM